jgi:hypothetical protein
VRDGLEPCLSKQPRRRGHFRGERGALRAPVEVRPEERALELGELTVERKRDPPAGTFAKERSMLQHAHCYL